MLMCVYVCVCVCVCVCVLCVKNCWQSMKVAVADVQPFKHQALFHGFADM